MKVRVGFVTNSSSASYLCVFAKVVDKSEAAKIINKHNCIRSYGLQELVDKLYGYTSYPDILQCDFAGGLDIRPSMKYLDSQDKDTTFVVIDDYVGEIDHFYEDWEYMDIEELHDDDVISAISDIRNSKAFTDYAYDRVLGRDG